MSSEPQVRIEFYPKLTAKRLEGAALKAQQWLDNEALKDSAPYVPRITGNLERSGINGTRVGTGILTYNVPYARPQYYTKGRHTTQAHPKATSRWFEVSKAVNKAKWLRGTKKIGGGG